MINHPLGPGPAQSRHYFEDDSQFHDRVDLIPMVISAYQKASGNAACTARQAVANGRDESWKKALWDEAVAQTLERVLSCLGVGSETGNLQPDPEISLPSRPEFG